MAVSSDSFAYKYKQSMKGTMAVLVIGFLLAPGFAVAAEKLVTFNDIIKISPKARSDLVQAFVDAEGEFTAAGIDTRLRMTHFIAQVMTETGGLRRIDENMNYSFKSLMRVFSRKVISEDKAREIAGKDRQIANWVYGNRLGNRGRATNDGWEYRGSGYIQLTGLANFRARGSDIGLPLADKPQMARSASEGLSVGIAYWKATKINNPSDDNDHRRVRILVNGPAAHGLDQSKVWFAKAWTKVFKAKEAVGFEGGEELANNEVLDESALFDDILSEGGLLSEGFESDADLAAGRAAALKKFQNEMGLPETGVLDEDTQYALLDPREWRHIDEGDVMPARTEPNPDQTVAHKLAPLNDVVVEEGGFLEPSEGTGKEIGDPNLARADADALDEARATYAEYEMVDPGDTPDTFEPHSVIKPDTRVAVSDTIGFPARAIVQIVYESGTGEKRLCSGTMISPDTVLTAGHCVHSGTRTGEYHKNFWVVPGRNKGAAPFGRCAGVATFLLSGWNASATTEESRYYDLGAIKLNCQIGNTTGWLGVRTLKDNERVATIVQGYASDSNPPAQQWISEDRLRLLWELKGFYQNDTIGGTSGAPVLAKGTVDSVIGVHTNGLHGNEEPWKSNNAFTRITPERLARIQEWIASN